MKIARVEAFHVDWGGTRTRSAWVRVWTDDGAYGLGEASPMVHGNASLEIIDIALWDLKGKLLGLPVWQLLGGAWRRELPFYASIGGNGQRTVDEVCRVVEQWLPVGPAQVKIRFDADKTAERGCGFVRLAQLALEHVVGAR